MACKSIIAMQEIPTMLASQASTVFAAHHNFIEIKEKTMEGRKTKTHEKRLS